jgi:hypothetical protein
VREGGGYSGFNDHFIDLRVDDHPLPIDELHRILQLHKLYLIAAYVRSGRKQREKCRDLNYCLCIVPLNWKPGSTLTQCSCVLSFDRLNRRLRVPPPGRLIVSIPMPVSGSIL